MPGTEERTLRYYLYVTGKISEIEGIEFTRWHKATRDGTEEEEETYKETFSHAQT